MSSTLPSHATQILMPVMALHERISKAPLQGPDYYLSEDSTSYEPRSPYPPSASSDSETDANISSPKSHHLHASIATVPEYRLREIMVKLVDRSPGFQHAVAKELLSPRSPSSSPLRQKPRRSGRPGSSDTIIPERKCGKCGKRVKYTKGHSYLRQEKCAFHPGHLEEEVYEFFSRTPDGHSLNAVRTITMWSCCDEDALTPGCATAPTHQIEQSEQEL